MDRLDAISLFVAAVDEGSLAGAARRMGRSPAAATRAIALLEQIAGETLLLRSTRKLSLTAAGNRHLVVWREVLSRLRELEPEGSAGPLRGTLVMTAPELFGGSHVLPLLHGFLQLHPKISARALLLNRIVDLVGEGVDLAVRLAALPDSSLSAIKLGEVQTLLCASPTYLERSGIPVTPADLSGHECLGLQATADGELWQFAVEPRSIRMRSVHVRTRLSINSAAAAVDGALRGYGIVQARSYQVAEHIAARRLVRLLPDFEPTPTPVHLVFHPDRGARGLVRHFIEYLSPRLRKDVLRLTQLLPPRG